MMKMTLNEEIEYLQSGNWYDKVRTVLSTDEYLKLGWAIGDILEVLELFRSLAPEPQTNADRIRSMTDKELAEFISVEGYELNTLRGAKTIIDRLAAYEDTGLEPEEIIDLKGRMEGLEK